MLHAIGSLQPPIDSHEARFQQFPPLFLGGPLPHNRVDHAVFVFERYEGHATGGFGSLAHPHEAGEPHALSVRQLGEVG